MREAKCEQPNGDKMPSLRGTKGKINPYISARFGRYTKGLGVRRTPRIKGDETNDGGTNVDMEKLGAHRTLIVPRAPEDNGVCYIDVWHDVGGMSGQHIGSTTLKTNDFALDDYREDTLTLYDDGTKEDGAERVGEVKLRMRWHQQNKLALQFLHLTDLKDVSGHVVADHDSFRDHQITLRALSLFGVYLIVGTICYDLYFRDCVTTSDDDADEVLQGNRLTNSTVNLISNSVNGVSNLESNIQQYGSDMADKDCEKSLSWGSFLDAMVFQFTSFTTVGYGTHPKNFNDDSSMLLTASYILAGMAIMGILAGSIGETVVRQVELYTQRLAMVTQDTVEFGVSAGVTGMTFGAKGTAKVITSVVPTGGGNDGASVTNHGGMTVAEIAEMEKEEAEEEVEEIKELKREEYSPFLQLFAASIGMVVIVLIGTFSYMEFDDLSFVEALYFSVVTVTTVGFGDLYPKSVGSKVFTIFYAPIGVVMFASAINTVSYIPLRYRKIKLEKYVLNQFEDQFSRYDLGVLKRSVDLSRNDPMTKNDFSLAMLLRLGKIKMSDLQTIEEVFFKLDVDHSGVLDQDDVDDLLHKTAARNRRELDAFDEEDVDTIDNPVEAAS